MTSDAGAQRRALPRYHILQRGLAGIAVLAIVVGGSAALMHATIEPGTEFARDPDAATRSLTLAGVKRWSRTDEPAGDSIAASSDVDMLVIDGRALNRLGPSAAQSLIEARQLRADGQRRLALAKLILSPMPAPAAFGAEDAPIDRLIALGADGVFLDAAAALQSARGARAEADLVGLIARLGLHARALNPAFIIVLSNAAELTADAAIMRAVDGVARDNLLFGLEAPGKRNSRADVGAALHDLNRARAAGRMVFVTEYMSDANTGGRRRVMEQLTALEFVPLLPARRRPL